MQQGFLPNFFSVHEAENMKQRRRLLKGNLPATSLSLRLSVSCLSFSVPGYLLITLVRSVIREILRQFLLLVFLVSLHL